MKALVGTFNQGKVLVGAFSVILKSSGTFVSSLSNNIAELYHETRHSCVLAAETPAHTSYFIPNTGLTYRNSTIIRNLIDWPICMSFVLV